MTNPVSDRAPYADRAAAGAALADSLSDLAGRDDLVVLGLPRGGVPVAAVVARELAARLDVLVVRKLGLPRHPEVAMGAVASGSSGSSGEVVVRNPEVIAGSRVSERAFAKVLRSETAELHRREELYRGSRSPVSLRDRTVVVVDDGLATGATMRVAVRVIGEQGAAYLAAAVPIGPAQVCRALEAQVDRLVCPWVPGQFTAVGAGYRNFGQTSNDEVRRLLGVDG